VRFCAPDSINYSSARRNATFAWVLHVLAASDLQPTGPDVVTADDGESEPSVRLKTQTS
jgi:hypothetical protein